MANTKTPAEYKDASLAILNDGKWSDAILITLIMISISIGLGIIPFIDTVANYIFGGPIAFGFTTYFIKISRRQFADINQLFAGFKRFVDCFVAFILMLIIICLGLLFLIVPGIIAAIALSQTFRIMYDDPNMKPVDALRASHEMMIGHRMDYFILILSFTGWALLSLLTLGLGFLALIPYASTAMTLFYNDLTKHTANEIEELGSHLEQLV